jgi:signal peptidase I
MTAKQLSFWDHVWDWTKSILIAFLLVFFINHFLVLQYKVDQHSMDSTLADGEHVLVNRVPYYFHEPQYGDIVVFHESNSEDWIKRVIGRPGDTILFKHGVLYRNGVAIPEPYIKEPMNPGDFGPYKIPAGELFVMGDNRNVSRDSREIGPIKISQVVGRAEFVLYPFQSFKKL